MSHVEFLELTYQGRGAIAVIGVRGRGARECIAACFRPMSGGDFSACQNRSIVYGIWNATQEDLIVVQTGIDSNDVSESFEVQCHGGFAAVASVKNELLRCGAVEGQNAADSVWSLSCDPWQTEISVALEKCLTQRTAKHLLQQYALWKDFQIESCKNIDVIESFSRFGKHLTQPWSVVLCGEPNVGKSSLINALSGFERAIVHETAGTTRDIVSQKTAIDGWPVELHDTAGIREATGEIESAGIEKARRLISSAELVVHVVDAANGSRFDADLSDRSAGLVVFNKIDRVPDQDHEHSSAQLPCPAVYVSAATGEGIDELQRAISRAIVPEIPSANQLVPVTRRQRELLAASSRNQRSQSQ